MNPRLHARLQHLCDLAKATPPERDVGPALDALGALLWSVASGDRDVIDAALGKRLKQLAARAHLALRAPTTDEDTTISRAVLSDIVRAAVLVLDRKSVADASPALSISKLHPPARTLARMINGDADGITTARYALHILDCTRCQHTLAALPSRDGTLRSVAASEPKLRLAAADLSGVRAPDEGRVIGRKHKPALEAALFDDADARRLAIYSTDDINIRVIASGITTEATLTGYCLTRLDAPNTNLDLTLHLDGKPQRWRLTLESTKPKPRKPRR